MIRLFAALLLLLAPSLSWGLAFPGAEGFGANTRGAYELYEQTGLSSDLPQIIHVTNLNDSGTGSFRAAVQTTGPRIVVFDIGGTINLQSSLVVEDKPYMTIAGQTAPGDGIMIRNGRFEIYNNHDIIIRGLRIRPGNTTSGSTPIDDRVPMAIRGDIWDSSKPGSHDIIVDHCSFSWSTDKLVTIWNKVERVSVTNSILAEPLRGCVGCNGGAHNYAIFAGPGGRDITIAGNVITHSVFRNPLIGGGGGTLGVADEFPGATNAEVVNNIVYNGREWGGMLVSRNGSYAGPQPQYVAIVGEYHKAGVNTGGTATQYVFAAASPSGNSGVDNTSRIYTDQCLSPRRTHDGLDPYYIYDTGSLNPNVRYDSGWPFPKSNITHVSATDNYESLITNHGMSNGIPLVGAFPRDPIDTRVLNEVASGTAFAGTDGSFVVVPGDVGGFPSYASGTLPQDSDDDGLPDAWDNGSPHADTDGDGYTDMEEYINSFFDGNDPGNPVTDSTPPNISNCSPTGLLPKGTSIVTLQCSTDEPAIFRWSFNSGDAWEDMQRMDSHDGATTHDVLIDGGFIDGMAYNIYVMAEDLVGNSTDMETVSFAIAAEQIASRTGLSNAVLSNASLNMTYTEVSDNSFFSDRRFFSDEHFFTD